MWGKYLLHDVMSWGDLSHDDQHSKRQRGHYGPQPKMPFVAGGSPLEPTTIGISWNAASGERGCV